MRSLRFSRVRSVVALGAHPDDIEIGAGGLLLSLRPDTDVHYVLCTGTPERQDEARAAAAAFLPTARLSMALHQLPDGRLPGHWCDVKEIVEAAADRGPVDLVLAPSREDAHQDHRLLADLVHTAFRDTLVLHYEIPKWDGDLGSRNFYLPMSEARMKRKAALLATSYPSQKSRDWWSEDVFLSIARLRGIECRSPYAEAYTCPKAVLTIR